MALIFLTLSILFQISLAFVTIDTPTGNIQGQIVAVNSSFNIEMYLGIPYAEPPVGNLRFANPVPKNPWGNSLFDATNFGPVCPQPLAFLHKYSFPPSFNNTSEDCLNLNIYVPQNDHMNRRFPVMIWVHGGAYRYGSGSEYDGRILASKGIIVVTINYRLGALGFLSTDDNNTSGNYGLLDQSLAFRWVRDNIHAFGGDPDKVTIAGQSAGGGSVSLHMFSNLSRGLFRGVIPQSGCALSPWAIFRLPNRVRDSIYILARKVGCNNIHPSDVVRCLRLKSAHELVNTYVAGPPMISAWAPRVDGYFIMDLPENILQQGNYTHNVSVMTGIVPNESADEIAGILYVENGFSNITLDQEMHKFATRFHENANKVFQALKCEYQSNHSTLEINRDLFIELKSDYGYIAPHVKLAEKHAADNIPTYFYKFDYRSPYDPEPKWMGVLHATELYFEFGSSVLSDGCNYKCIVTWPTQQNWTTEDRRMSEKTMTIWTNFVKYLNPNPLPSSTHWPRYETINKAYLDIAVQTAVKYSYKPDRIYFWNEYIPKVLNGTATTDCHHNTQVSTANFIEERKEIRAMKIAKLDKTNKSEKPQMLKAYTRKRQEDDTYKTLRPFTNISRFRKKKYKIVAEISVLENKSIQNTQQSEKSIHERTFNRFSCVKAKFL